jgi:lipid A oxidase
VDHAGSSFTAGWKGKSFSPPPYYGLRYTRWSDRGTGWSFNLTHAKAYADGETLAKNGGYQRLEFTDGSNPITINHLWKFAPIDGLTPHFGLGAGIAVPHVEIQRVGETRRTFEYQYGGPVLRFALGLSRPFTERWGWFVEYDFHYLMLDVEHHDGRLKTNLIHNALNFGLSYRF